MLTIFVKNLGELQLTALEIYVRSADECAISDDDLFRGSFDRVSKILWFDDEDRMAVYERLCAEANAAVDDDGDAPFCHALTKLATRVLRASSVEVRP